MHKVPRDKLIYECGTCGDDTLALVLSVPSREHKLVEITASMHLDEADREDAESICTNAAYYGAKRILDNMAKDND